MNRRYVLITGGAGFVGSNLANRLLDTGRPVVLLDDLSRGHVHRNVQWLKRRHGDEAVLQIADVCDAEAVDEAVGGAEAVFHLAAQVAVTTSLDEPRKDFEVNARGTLNVLEAVRRQSTPPLVVFTSTNKVYGEMEDVSVGLVGERYAPSDDQLRSFGVSEDRPLHFHSPYGCSKGAADQYVLDYAKTYGIPATVLRMSCIYGPRQFGNEDQGWVAHFLIRSLRGAPISIYGDGRQVRDVLFVDDLVDAFQCILEQPDAVTGRAFNIGGGPDSTLSLLDLLDHIATLHGRRPDVQFDDWRRADQRWYVSDPRRFSAATGWSASTPVAEGLRRLHHWLGQLDRNAPPTTVRRRRRVPVPALERS